MTGDKPIVLCGEAWGEQEQKIQRGFCGPSGAELLRMLNESGIIELTSTDHDYLSAYYRTGDPRQLDMIWNLHQSIVRTNVFQQHPPRNQLEFFTGPKATGIAGFPALIKSGYVRREFEHHLDRLSQEILSLDPNLVICLGNSALWALAGRTGITKLRGTTLLSTHTVADFKLLPTYHPAAVLRQWELRPTAVADLMKAARESAYPEIRRPKREIWIEPSLEDIIRFRDEHIQGCQLLGADIETVGSRITCIGFAVSNELGIVIPFDDARSKNGSYWKTEEDERSCWRIVRGILEDRHIPKLFHNGAYDVAFIWRSTGIKVLGCTEDSMLLSHAIQPESLKGLGYLGSVFSDEMSWKHMRTKNETVKRDA